jgi:hypothetical protein
VIGTGESIPLHLEVVSAPGPGAPRRPIALDATRYQRALLPMWLLTTAVVVLGLGIAAYAVLRGPADDGVLVPSVRTLTAAEATLALQRAGFQVEPRSVQSTLDAGMAVETSPAEGQSAPEGSTVTLFVSSGPPAGKVQVPPVVALTREEAERRLLDLGLIPRFATAFSDDVPAGEVIRSEPASPAEVNAGSEVVVFVSDGPEPTPTQTTPEPTMTEPTTTPPPELPDPGFETVARPLDPTRGVLTVTTVRDGENTDFDRVVLEATGPLDGYEVDYDDLGFLIVSIEKVTAGDLPPVVTGLNRVAGYIVETDPGAETLRLTIETPFQGPFRAFTVPAEPAEGQPERLVVDVFDP